jgi:hypothetical protein
MDGKIDLSKEVIQVVWLGEGASIEDLDDI